VKSEDGEFYLHMHATMSDNVSMKVKEELKMKDFSYIQP